MPVAVTPLIVPAMSAPVSVRSELPPTVSVVASAVPPLTAATVTLPAEPMFVAVSVRVPGVPGLPATVGA